MMPQATRKQRQQRHYAAQDELLRTKLLSPRLSTQLVPRPALLDRLDQGLERKVTLISAPAGFGKTTLASQWLAARIQCPDAQPVAWVSLDASDNEPVRFWRYVLTACQIFEVPGNNTGDNPVGSKALALLDKSAQPPFETILTSFINDLAQLSTPAILVLEDYHVVESRQIHEMMVFLLDHLPSPLHLVMLTRQDPPFPLARLRARHELHELGPLDLRFSQAETEAFLRQAIPFSLSEEMITRLANRTEGWAAGLRLVVLALQTRQESQEIEEFLIGFTGSHGHILEYLAEEVLHAQPEPIQTFLLQTTFLDRLTAPLCNVVTGRNDSAQLLDQLVRAHLFLIPLDGAGQWYRYHGLFAEAMRHYTQRHLAELGMDEAEVLALHERASRWYEAHGLLNEAVEIALSANAFSRAIELIEHLTKSGRYREPHTLRRWIEQLPEDLLRNHPGICLSHAFSFLYTLDRAAPTTAALIEKPLQIAEEGWRLVNNEPRLGQLYAFRSMVAFWQGEFSATFAAARQALELLPEEDIYWRGISYLFVALGMMFAGEMNAARQKFLDARSLCEVAQNSRGVRAAMIFLTQVCMEQGELEQSEQLARQVLAEAGDDRLDQGHALTDLARLAYARNELDTIDEYLSPALDIGRQHAAELGEQFALEALVVPASLVLAQVEHARGETGQARQRLQALLAETQISSLLRRDVDTWQARLAFMDGDIATVERWRAAYAQEDDQIFPLYQEREERLHARILIHAGESNEALRMLEPWQTRAHAGGRTAGELETLIVIALAHFAQGDQSLAKQTLIQALTLAHSSGYQRLFLDEGQPMVALLQAVYPDVRAQPPLAAYVRNLLHAFAGESAELPAAPASDTPILIEPLSAQEGRVLRLLVAGLSNPEIAEQLVVSVNTVKTQVQSIYTKLDVHSREEARDVARQLRLL